MPVGLRLFTDRVGDGAGAPVIDSGNGEELVLVQPGVSAVLAGRPPESPGTLYISTKYTHTLFSLSLSPSVCLKLYEFLCICVN